jgi:nucleoside-diphosphate-sugar epimerase
MKVFLAGATGVLGRPTARALIEAGHEVRGTARGEEKSQLLRSLGAEPVSVDLFDSDAVRTAVAGSEAVLHFATKIPPLTRMRWKRAWRENDRLRTDATHNLVDAAIAAGASTFLYESITFTYGEHGDEWVGEDDSLAISWASLNSTIDAERQTKRFTDSGGRGVALRYAIFYAPYARSTLDTLDLARRRLLLVPGDGLNFVSSIHVDDAATAAVTALNAPAGIYNVTDDEPLRMRDYAQAITEALGMKRPRRVPEWLFRLVGGGPAKYILSSQRICNIRFKEKTGWAPRFRSARDGWQQIAAELAERPEHSAVKEGH